MAPSRGGVSSPISRTLIYTAKQAVLVDPPIVVKPNEELVEWTTQVSGLLGEGTCEKRKFK